MLETDKEFFSYEDRRINNKLDELKDLYKLDMNNNITSHRKIIGPVIVFGKKIVRKFIYVFLRWYIEPILAKQQKFNLETIETLETMQNAYADRFKIYDEKMRYVYKKLNVKCDINLLDKEIDYFDFENKFRGERKDIINKQRKYVKYFENKPGAIVDLGSGRGEFLEIMRENNIQAYGVDIYEPFVNYCMERGLDVRNGDALTYLDSLPDESLGGIFMDSIIEHLEEDYMLALINRVYRKLKKDCYCIIIAPNPDNFGGLSCFNIDLDHKKPLHYLTLEYLLKKEGFSEITRYEDPEADFYLKVRKIRGENISNIEEFNEGMGFINTFLLGNREYVAIVKK